MRAVDGPPPEGQNGNGAAHAAAEAARERAVERDALKLLIRQLAELRGSVSLYVTAQLDSAKASVRSALLGLILAALGAVAVASLVVTASVFVLSAVAEGLGRLFGDQPWIGTLLTGLLTLAGVGLGAAGAVSARRNRDRAKAVEKYAARRAQQRARFGRDAAREPATVCKHD
jgi:hypothetical protein